MRLAKGLQKPKEGRQQAKEVNTVLTLSYKYQNFKAKDQGCHFGLSQNGKHLFSKHSRHLGQLPKVLPFKGLKGGGMYK